MSERSGPPAYAPEGGPWTLYRCPRCGRVGTDAEGAVVICTCVGAVERIEVTPVRRGFPWPSNGQREHAAAALAAERDARDRQEQQWADDLGVPKSAPRPLTDEETVLIVLWALRGDR